MRYRSETGYLISYENMDVAYTAVLRLIGLADPQAAQSLHDSPYLKEISIAVIESEPKGTLLRLTFLGERGLEILNLLANTVARRPRITSSKGTSFIVEGLDLTDAKWSRIYTWQDILVAKPANYIRISFETLTAIMKQSLDRKRYSLLWPDPASIFKSISRKWKNIGGPGLPDQLEEFLDNGGCIISDVDIWSEKYTMSNTEQKGFRGSVTYKFQLGDEDCRLAITRLVVFAYFSGIGYQTARGLGLVSASIE